MRLEVKHIHFFVSVLFTKIANDISKPTKFDNNSKWALLSEFNCCVMPYFYDNSSRNSVNHCKSPFQK